MKSRLTPSLKRCAGRAHPAGAALLARRKAGSRRRDSASREQRPVPLSFAQSGCGSSTSSARCRQLQHPAGLPPPGRARRRGAAARARRDRRAPRGAAHHASRCADGLPQQVVGAASAVRAAACSICGTVADGAREARARRVRATASRSAPSTSRPTPLLRAGLAAAARRGHVLVLTLHHIVSDGWSLGVLDRELAALYAAFAAASPPPLPPLPVQYADYSEWQRERAAAATCWNGSSPTGAGSSPALPRARAARPTGRARRSRAIAGAQRALRRSRRRSPRRSRTWRASEDATLFMTLLAAFQVLLLRYIGPGGHRRRHADRRPQPAGDRGADRLLRQHAGLRGDLSGNPTFSRAAGARARARARRLRAPGPAVRAAGRGAAPERDLSRNPLFQVMFVLQNAPSRRCGCRGLALARAAAADAGTREVRPDALR